MQNAEVTGTLASIGKYLARDNSEGSLSNQTPVETKRQPQHHFVLNWEKWK